MNSYFIKSFEKLQQVLKFFIDNLGNFCFIIMSCSLDPITNSENINSHFNEMLDQQVLQFFIAHGCPKQFDWQKLRVRNFGIGCWIR